MSHAGNDYLGGPSAYPDDAEFLSASGFSFEGTQLNSASSMAGGLGENWMSASSGFGLEAASASGLGAAFPAADWESASAGFGSSSPFQVQSQVQEQGVPTVRASFPSPQSLDASHRPAVSQLGRPLRITSIGPCLVRGGAEQWLIYLERFLDPRRCQLQRAIVTNPKHLDPHFAAELKTKVEVGTPDVVRRAAADSDVLVIWGVPADRVLNGFRPRLSIFIAHGDGPWTRQRLMGSSSVIDHVAAVSDRVRTSVCSGFPTTVIYNGVDQVRLAESRPREDVRAQFGFSRDDFVLGFMGRFSEEKRVDRIIDALAMLPPRFKGFFVGWGVLQGRLLQAANDRIPGRFAFTTAAEHLGDYYGAMDAKCLVSREEGFSLALLEAMMCRKPVIVTPVGSVPEVIQDRINGVVVDGSPESIARAAMTLAEHPEWARAIGLEGARFATAHGHARKMAHRYQDLFESLWVQKYGTCA